MHNLTLKRLLITGAALAGVAAITVAALRLGAREREPVRATPPAAAAAAGDVSCAGRIEPLVPVTRVGAPYVNGHPALVAELKVREGDRVQAGQVLATLDGRLQLDAALRQAEARIVMETARLEQVKAQPRSSDVAIQTAEVARLQTAYDNAKTEYGRYEALHRTSGVSTSELDAKRTDMDNARRLLDQAAARLQGLSEWRPADLRVAESSLLVARAEAERLRVEIQATSVQAPAAGTVLRIRANRGEEVGPQGLLELAQTDAMGVIAEVYETDIARVKVGQRARVTSDLLPSALVGTVTLIGSEIGRADVPPVDPAAFADSRVVRVQIRLPDGAPVAGLIHGKVAVVIER